MFEPRTNQRPVFFSLRFSFSIFYSVGTCPESSHSTARPVVPQLWRHLLPRFADRLHQRCFFISLVILPHVQLSPSPPTPLHSLQLWRFRFGCYNSATLMKAEVLDSRPTRRSPSTPRALSDVRIVLCVMRFSRKYVVNVLDPRFVPNQVSTTTW